jgi:tetratricopeptide (TPR) repeat protein
MVLKSAWPRIAFGGSLALILLWACCSLSAAQGSRSSAPSHANPAQTQVARGKQDLETKRYASAVRSFSAALRRDPAYAEAYLLRGIAQDKLGLTQKALQDFKRYIDLKPKDPEGYIRRGDAKNFNQEHDAAIQDYTTAIKLAPSSPAAYLGRGLAYAALEKYNDAIKDYQWVVKLEPSNTEALANLGVACMLAGRKMESMSYFETALKLEKDPQWRSKIEKWMGRILQESEIGREKTSGPASPRVGPRRDPLW